MNILFYSSFNARARDAETLMLAFKKQGHRVVSLTQAEGKPINDILRNAGIQALSYNIESTNSFSFILRHMLYLIKLCKRENIEVIYCHLEPSSFIGVLSQYFLRAKVYLCRHHIDEAMLYGFNKSLSYRLTYTLAKKVIVVSEKARQFMIESEGISPKKIIHINLAYDFSLFSKPNSENVKAIQLKFNASILLVTVGRLTKFKRPELSIEVLKVLKQNGFDAKLIILGNGELYDDIHQIILDEELRDRVFLTGHVPNVLEYMAAATFLLHPSVLESSCVAVKEAGLVNLPVIVCKNVGDFDDYMVNEENGFVVEKDNFVNQAANIVQTYANDNNKRKKITSKLNEDVIRIFSVDHIIDSYSSLNAKH